MPSRWLVIAAALVGVLGTVEVLRRGALTNVDHLISRQALALRARDHPGVVRWLYVLTLPGQRGTVLALTVPTVGFLCWRERSLDPAVRYGCALLLLAGSVYALKLGVARYAPPVDGVNTATGRSFPSGHLANSVIVWGVLAWSAAAGARVPDWLRRTLRALSVAGPAAVVAGMTLLNYHWFSDFLAAGSIGVLVLWIVLHPAWTALTSPIDRLVFGLPR